MNREFNNELKPNPIKKENDLNEVKIVKEDENEKTLDNKDFNALIKDYSLFILKILPAIFIGATLHLLDSISFGPIVFPSHGVLPKTYIQAGISMCLVR